ncbi:DNA polymerase III subunit delta [Flaviflexus huanghaiensis]|uniref:DNA polymerase III subunit delta n=1 Tax=Flaviflexus huanghaiensis TaxID=1111473 RepID=UPI0015F8FA8F|nr:DNA polymerase III subunit delta [Flaviflexus huanghaiensis]
MAQAKGVTWDTVKLAPVVLIKSKEDALADRAWESLVGQARRVDPEVDVVKLDSLSYGAGDLAVLASPSLFGGAKICLIGDLENMGEELQTDLLELIAHPSPDLFLVGVRNGGNRGAKVFTACEQAGFPVVTIGEVKWDSDKLALLTSDARRANRALTDEAAHALVASLGNDVREMLAALRQLFSDVEGTIGEQHVRTYFGSRVEADGFEIADALIAGNTGRALQLLRHALATGTSEVLIIANLAWKFRQLAQVSTSTGRDGHDVTISGSPHQIRAARNSLRSWSDAALAGAITAIAQADGDVKGFRGESHDPAYAVERCLRRISAARRL